VGGEYVFGIPVPVLIAALAFIVCWFVLSHMRFGRYVYAVGGNEQVTRLAGISVTRVKIAVYAVSGLLAALAGIILTARLESAQPTAGTAYELDAIAAVVLGGTSLMGGRGRIFGTLIGALIIGVLNNALNLMDVSSYYQMIAKGAVILLAVLVDSRGKTNQ
jgi:ribose transport system permease protein